MPLDITYSTIAFSAYTNSKRRPGQIFHSSVGILITLLLLLGLLQLHLEVLQSQAVLPVSILLSVPVHLLALATAIAKSMASAAKLALFALEFSPTSATEIS